MKVFYCIDQNLKFKGLRGIYRIFNTVTGRSYVGKSEAISKRIVNHFSYAEKGGSPKSYFYRSIRKYGRESFRFQVLFSTTDKAVDLNRKEVFWIKKIGSMYPDGYNGTPGGTGGNTTLSFSAKQRSKMRAIARESAEFIHARADSDPVYREKRRAAGSKSMQKLLQDKAFMRRRNASVSRALSKPVFLMEDGKKIKKFASIQAAGRATGVSEHSVSRVARGLLEEDWQGNVWSF